MIRDAEAPPAARLVGLDEAASEDRAVTGNKAATLAVLRRAGFPVPPGIVVPADALRAVDDDLPVTVRAALASVADVIGPGPWAVRSSSAAEDTERASFAGQFETVLNVSPAELASAVLRCVRSARSERVRAYGAERGTSAMAVLIQPMIPADAAGVAFTRDPVSGARRIVIEAVTGLGERLVSGAATPERWTLEVDGSIGAPSSTAVLSAGDARAIGDLARRVEERLGGPQDIEWALASGSLWLLQARPITTLATVGPEFIPIQVDVPPGYWERDAFHEPRPLSPLGRHALLEQILKVFPSAIAEFGILLDRTEIAFIGGWVYRQHIPLGAPPPGRGPAGPPPRWLFRVLTRLHPALRRRIDAAARAVASDIPGTVIRRWNDEWKPEFQADIQRALALDLRSLSDRDLAAELDHRIEVIGHPAHLMVVIAYWITVYELAAACRDLLGWDSARTLTLLDGLSTASTEPPRELARLAQLARSKPAIRELIARADETTPSKLADVDPAFAQAFWRYVQAYGHRALIYDIIEPTLAETPHHLLRLISDQLARSFSAERMTDEALGRRGRAADEAHRLLVTRSPVERERFERALARARAAYPALEDNVAPTQSVQFALFRYLALEIGRRLVERGQIATVDDVFFLDLPEARAALLDRVDRRETARLRKGQRAWAIANPGPYAYGDRPALPPFDVLPPPARLVNEGVVWGLTQMFGEPPGVRDEHVVAGTPASPGRYTGTVRVVMGEHEFGKIRPGDVVVCPTTSPTWSVVFPSMGALVTDGGGILSHPAIIAREHGIPAVVGTGNGTATLKDGQRVTVDGTLGVVEAGGPSS